MNRSVPASDVHVEAVAKDSNLVRTRFGIEFDANEDVWPIDGKRVINAAAIRSLMSPDLLPGLEMTLRESAARYSWATLAQYGYSLTQFQKKIFPNGKITRWNIADIRAYRVEQMKSFGHEDGVRSIRSLLVNWNKGRWLGVSKEFISALCEMKLKGTQTGRSVRVMDAQKGPLSLDEKHDLIQSLHETAERGALTLSDYSLAYLHLMTGRRPIQSAHLKCRDVVLRMGSSEPAYPQGRLQHLLAIPRAKQKGHSFRETRRAIDLNPENFQIFSSLRENVQNQFRAELNRIRWKLQNKDLQDVLNDLPMYPDWTSVTSFLTAANELLSTGRHDQALKALRQDAGGAAWHRTPGFQGKKIVEICESVGALSRDGTPIKITATRLRYTKGTDLAREGLSSHIIAWLLDQSTSRSAEIYIDNLPERAAQINGALANSITLNRFAKAFRGEVVASEADALGGSDPLHSRLTYQGEGTATCGNLKQCGLDEGVPFVCYPCNHFQPWLDGPHEQLLENLLSERQENITLLGADSPVATRRDKLIIAVQNVVDLCQAYRDKVADELAKK